MSPQQDNEPRDEALNRLYQQGAKVSPPAHLDRSILAAAHRAVGARPHGHPAAYMRRWAKPVAAAALIVLCVGLVNILWQDTRYEFDYDDAVSVDETAPVVRAPSAEERAKVHESEINGQFKSEPKAKEAKKQPMEKRMAAEVERFAPKPKLDSAKQIQREDTPARAIEADGGSAEIGAVQTNEARTEAKRREAAYLGKKQRAVKRLRHEQGARPPAPAFDQPVMAGKALRPETGSIAASPGARPVSPDALVAADKAVTRDRQRSPEAWIKEIQQLYKDNRPEKALEELRKLKTAYPNTALPDDLKEKLDAAELPAANTDRQTHQ